MYLLQFKLKSILSIISTSAVIVVLLFKYACCLGDSNLLTVTKFNEYSIFLTTGTLQPTVNYNNCYVTIPFTSMKFPRFSLIPTLIETENTFNPLYNYSSTTKLSLVPTRASSTNTSHRYCRLTQAVFPIMQRGRNF